MTGNPAQDQAWSDYDSAWNEYDEVKQEMDAKGGAQNPQDLKRLKQARDNKDTASKNLSKTSFSDNKAGQAQSKCPWGNTKANLAKAFGPEKGAESFKQFQQTFADDPAAGEKISRDFAKSRDDLESNGIKGEQAEKVNHAMWESRNESIQNNRKRMEGRDSASVDKLGNSGECFETSFKTEQRLKGEEGLNAKATPTGRDEHYFITAKNDKGEDIHLDPTASQYTSPKDGGPERRMVFTKEEHEQFTTSNGLVKGGRADFSGFAPA